MKNNTRKDNERRRLPVLLHITGWIILFILPQFLLTGESFWDKRGALIIFFNTIVYGIIFYVNYLFLIPRLLHLRRGLWYFPTAVVFIVFMQVATITVFRPLFPPSDKDMRAMTEAIKEEPHRGRFPKRMMAYNFYITSILVTGFALGLRYGEQSRRRERELKELEREKLDSELAMLKNQISPHFFFNTLNNIYSLIEINTDDARVAVLNLSKMMRYLLYESEHGNVRLSRELEFMKNYIDLMKLRMNARVRLDVSFPESYDDVDVPPLLFIAFIENAFKHSATYQGDSFIGITLTTDGSIITFVASNSVGSHASDGAPEVDSGIGLENVRKRLALIFGKDYDLNIARQDGVYTVTLTIDTAKAAKA